MKYTYKVDGKETGYETPDLSDRPHRFLQDTGGWAYVQFPNGNILYIEVPIGFEAGGVLSNPSITPEDYLDDTDGSAQAAWVAITDKFGRYEDRHNTKIAKSLVLVSLFALLWKMK